MVDDESDLVRLLMSGANLADEHAATSSAQVSAPSCLCLQFCLFCCELGVCDVDSRFVWSVLT